MKKTYRAFGYVNALRADRMWVHFFHNRPIQALVLFTLH